MAKKKIPTKYLPRVETKERFHLSDAPFQMSRELGPNPKKFGSLVNMKQEPWKMPLPEFNEELYFKRFKRNRPDNICSIEQIVRDAERRRAERTARKQAAR